MSLNLFSIQAPILVGSNYEFWSLRMQFFAKSGMLGFCAIGFQEPDATTIVGMTISQRNKLEEQKQKEGREKSCILSSLDDAYFPK
jgi:hypothetical protein